jgi:YD repeat-containing protein
MPWRVEPVRRFVYVIQSVTDPQRRYVGLTWDVSKRLTSHNDGQSPQTARHRPWRLVVYLGFATGEGAAAFAKYLKSGAGRPVVERLVGE